MDKLTNRKSAVLEVLDAQIEELEKKLAKFQPFIEELNDLKQTRRVLLSEKKLTGGRGGGNAQLTQEMVINFMREQDGPVSPEDIAKHYNVPGASVRSHLNRHKNHTYDRTDDGWSLIEGEDELAE